MTTPLVLTRARGRAGSRALRLPAHAGLAAVLVAYAASALVIPTLANVAVTDDWVYYRSVETLLIDRQLRVHDMSSAALVFQTVWGALFAAVFGLSFGALRISTLAMVALGGAAFYALCLELQVSRAWSTLGTAACLFHPLLLSLAFTFMTDAHFLGLVLITTWLYVRGVRAGQAAPAWLLAGSAVAACGVLVRQQGVLVPAALVVALLLGGRLRPLRHGLAVLLQTCAIPAAAAVAYGVWLRFGNGVPWALTLFWTEIPRAGWVGVLALLPRLGVIEAVYVGLFVLPIALALAPGLPALGRGLGGSAAWAALAWAALVGFGVVVNLSNGLTMPYVGQFVTATGIGPEDVIAARPVLLDPSARLALTLACALASMLAGLAIARRIGAPGASLGVGIVSSIALGQVVGTVPPSIHFIGWGGTLDRYLLPLLPFALVLLLWAARGARPVLPLAWLAVVVMGAWSVAGTRDHLVFLDSVWSLAREANAMGIADTRLDAGAGWDGFHMYEQPPDPSIRPRTPNPPWWADLFAPRTDSSYIVAGARLPEYAVVLERGYWSWLQQRWLPLYLLRRPGIPGPP